jgi:hypothetical protein
MVSVASPHTTRPVGVRRGKGYADEFAQGFIGWCRRGVGRKFSITVGDLQGLAEHDYAAALGIPMPPARSMLSAIQRLEGVEVRHGLRGRLSGGRKTTVYTISMDADAASNDRAA